jgi:diguanylate cyclase (GGDEF)-like protein
LITSTAFSKFSLRPVNQGSTYLGVAMMALIWLGLYFHLKAELKTVQEHEIRDASNLSRAFEEHLVRILEDVDHSLQIVRNAYERSPETFDLASWSKDEHALEGPSFQIVIIGQDGIMKATTEGLQSAPVDLSDREHFRVHINTQDDNLFISKPVLGRVTGKPSLQISRRIRAADGAFGGVILISLDPNHFTRFYESIDIGHEGVIRVVGSDGVVRAVGQQIGTDAHYVGIELSGSTLLNRARSAPSGWYFTGSGKEDGIRRLVFYRVVPGYPLMVTVGLGVDEMFSEIFAKKHDYQLIAVILTLLILVVMGLSLRDRERLERTGKQLHVQNARFDAALNNMSHGLAMVDAKGQLVVCNKSYVEMFRLSSEDVRPGTPIGQLLEYKIAKGCHPRITPGKYAQDRLSLPSKIERLTDKRDLLVLSQPMTDGGWVTTYEDVTERLQTESRIAHMARHDALTGLPNRVLFLERLDQAVDQCQSSGKTFTLFMLDLDCFKAINDTLGHGAGDILLQNVADRLRLSTRLTEIVARLGGDEFAILQMGKVDQREAATAMAAEMIDRLSQPYHINGHEVIVGCSIGLAMAPDHGIIAEQLLRNSDLALYHSKSTGRNGYYFFEAILERKARLRSALESDLRHALERGEFEIHYQPVVDIATRSYCGMEALLRWKRGDRGDILPSQFIPIAEDIGLITSIGRWTLYKACNDAMTWPSHLRLAVNLSPVQFGGDLKETVLGALTDSGLPPHRLELEITESVLLEGSVDNIRMLGSLKALGVKIVLDDFGTGYSSLTYLSMFAFDKVKIDRSFVSQMVDRADCAAIVCSIINLGRNLNMTTVAEGVETEQQLIMLQAAGCSEAQGYLFSRALHASGLELAYRLAAAS